MSCTHLRTGTDQDAGRGAPQATPAVGHRAWLGPPASASARTRPYTLGVPSPAIRVARSEPLPTTPAPRPAARLARSPSVFCVCTVDRREPPGAFSTEPLAGRL